MTTDPSPFALQTPNPATPANAVDAWRAQETPMLMTRQLTDMALSWNARLQAVIGDEGLDARVQRALLLSEIAGVHAAAQDTRRQLANLAVTIEAPDWSPRLIGATAVVNALVTVTGQAVGILAPTVAAGVATAGGVQFPYFNRNDWRTAIRQDLAAGVVSRHELAALLAELASEQPPGWREVERLARDYKANGWRYTMEAFAKKHNISRATLDRDLRQYEAITGEQIRPGRGRRRKLGRN